MIRVQKPYILKDLDKKLVFLVGPRQVGKTWLAKNIAREFTRSLYLNYDKRSDRKIMHDESWLESTELLILDELHKMEDWKNYIKGVYDTKPDTLRILVTGSSRLDVFEKMGDSLAGRYFKHRLMPLSLAELTQNGSSAKIDPLLLYGGFPEPYLSNDTVESNRWRLQYINSLLSTDVFEFDKIQNLKAMRLTFDLLRTRVASPVSYQSLSEDIGVSPITVKKYIQILEALYIVFRVTPYSKNIARSLLKEPKIYFFDTGLVQGNEGAKLENLVALSLLKHAYAKTDILAEEYFLHYLRTKDGQEVDFALVKEDKITQMIEVKLSDSKVDKTLQTFHEKYQYPAIQLVKNLRNEYRQGAIQILNAEKFLSELMI
jgi:predicted AAA+ superfamily ATPase